VAARTGHPGRPDLQAAVRVRGGPARQTMHASVPLVHEDMGRDGPQGIHALLEAARHQECQGLPDQRDWRHGVQLGSRQDKRRGN